MYLETCYDVILHEQFVKHKMLQNNMGTKNIEKYNVQTLEWKFKEVKYACQDVQIISPCSKKIKTALKEMLKIIEQVLELYGTKIITVKLKS